MVTDTFLPIRNKCLLHAWYKNQQIIVYRSSSFSMHNAAEAQ